ncbi:TSUP family transporter [soil metagenome]
MVKMSTTDLFLLIGGGFFGGLIDSIVGGGGLITVPVFLLLLGPVPAAIGTNKIAGVSAQLAALVVYLKNSHVDLNRAWRLLLITSLGAVAGASFSRYLPTAFFKWFLIGVAPVVLALVFTRKLWNKPIGHVKSPRLAVIGIFVAGFYDGIAGPGGGTLMFLVLFLLGGMPATVAMGTGKLANLGSASFSLSTYALQGNVDWVRGATMAVPIALGAFLGARYSSRHSGEDEARKLARTGLLVVSVLLVTRWLVS